MTHLDDGRLRAYMDEEWSDADASAMRLHLEKCDTCRDRLAELEGRNALVAQALGQLDTAAPTAGARAALLERIASVPRKPFPRAFRMPPARAAMFALFLGAGVATALPASPVRGWIAAGWARATDLFDSGDDAGTSLGPTGEAAQNGMPAGVRLDATGQEISIVFREIGPGTLIVVRIVPGGQAGVFARDPATFRTAEGRIEVTGAVDRVLVDLPQEAAVVSIEVNDRMYLRKEGDRIDTTGPIEERTTEEIHLRVP